MFKGSLAPIESDNVKPRPDEVGGHWGPHDAEPDECDPDHAFDPSERFEAMDREGLAGAGKDRLGWEPA